MSTGLYSHTTRGTGTILTALIYNADHQNHITNQNPEMTGAYSDSVGEFQTTFDPGGVGSENLPANLADELAAQRFVIQAMHGGSQWYDVPAVPIGPGDVVGPAGGVVDAEFAQFDGTTGKLLQGSSLLAASVAEVRSAAADRVLLAALLESAAAEVTLTDAATIALDWDTFFNGVVTLTANRILGNPTNGQPGTYRTVRVLGNDATNRTLTFGNQYLGTVPTITDADNDKEYLVTIRCITSTHFACVANVVNT